MTNIKKPKYDPTLQSKPLTYFTHRIYECIKCGQQLPGVHMKTARINRHARSIPTDREIMESTICKRCAPKNWTWLKPAINYARLVRQERVERALRLMEATLYGDSEKPFYVRQKYRRQYSKIERSQMTLDHYERLIAGCDSTEAHFLADEDAHRVLQDAKDTVDCDREAARARQVFDKASKREASIKARIEAGRLERATNTLIAAKRDFPDFLWGATERALKIAKLERDMKQAIDDDNEQKLIELISVGEHIYPDLRDWEDFALTLMNG